MARLLLHLARDFYATFPLEDGPAGIACFCKQGKYSCKVRLAVTKETKSPGTLCPWLITAINTDTPRISELGVFYVECFYSVAVKLYELEII